MFRLDTTSVSPAQLDSGSASYRVPIIRVCAVRVYGPVSSKGSVIPPPERERKGVEKEKYSQGLADRASEREWEKATRTRRNGATIFELDSSGFRGRA